MLRYLCHMPKQEPYSFRIDGVGLHEPMPPSIVNRPKGTDDYLLMYFHTPVRLKVNGKESMHPANTLMLWTPSDGHYYGNPEKEYLHSWIHFLGRDIPIMLKSAGIIPGHISFHETSLFESYIQQLYNERVLQPDPNPTILKNLLHNLFIEIARKSISTPLPSIPEGVLKAKQYIDINYTHSIKLDKLAKMASYSIPHFSAEFKKHFHISPIDYAIQLKLEHACYLLKDRNLNIADIAERLGYNDMFYFSRQFKKYFKTSPNNFRKNIH